MNCARAKASTKLKLAAILKNHLYAPDAPRTHQPQPSIIDFYTRTDCLPLIKTGDVFDTLNYEYAIHSSSNTFTNRRNWLGHQLGSH